MKQIEQYEYREHAHTPETLQAREALSKKYIFSDLRDILVPYFTQSPESALGRFMGLTAVNVAKCAAAISYEFHDQIHQMGTYDPNFLSANLFPFAKLSGSTLRSIIRPSPNIFIPMQHIKNLVGVYPADDNDSVVEHAVRGLFFGASDVDIKLVGEDIVDQAATWYIGMFFPYRLPSFFVKDIQKNDSNNPVPTVGRLSIGCKKTIVPGEIVCGREDKVVINVTVTKEQHGVKEPIFTVSVTNVPIGDEISFDARYGVNQCQRQNAQMTLVADLTDNKIFLTSTKEELETLQKIFSRPEYIETPQYQNLELQLVAMMRLMRNLIIWPPQKISDDSSCLDASQWVDMKTINDFRTELRKNIGKFKNGNQSFHDFRRKEILSEALVCSMIDQKSFVILLTQLGLLSFFVSKNNQYDPIEENDFSQKILQSLSLLEEKNPHDPTNILQAINNADITSSISALPGKNSLMQFMHLFDPKRVMETIA